MNTEQNNRLQRKEDFTIDSSANDGQDEIQSQNPTPIRVEVKGRHGRTGTHQFMEVTLPSDERIRRSLNTTSPEEAEDKVQDALLDLVHQRIERRIPKIGDLYWTYESNRLPIGKQASDDTKRKNVVAMRRILGKYGIDDDCDIRYFAKKQPNGQPIAEHYAQFERKVTDVRMARSLFSKGWIKYYKDRCGIDTSFFNNWIALSLASVKVKPFHADERERVLIEEKCAHLKELDVELYKAYALAYGLGLRSSEIQRAKYSDLWETEGNKIIRIWSPKGVADDEVDGVGFQDRPCDPSWWELIMEFKSGEDDLIVLAQEDRIVRDFPRYLRDVCGVTDKRPVHRLRKYAGHRAMRQNGNSIYTAKSILGHSSVEMTAKIYAGLPSVNRSF